MNTTLCEFKGRDGGEINILGSQIDENFYMDPVKPLLLLKGVFPFFDLEHKLNPPISISSSERIFKLNHQVGDLLLGDLTY